MTGEFVKHHEISDRSMDQRSHVWGTLSYEPYDDLMDRMRMVMVPNAEALTKKLRGFPTSDVLGWKFEWEL